MLIQVIHLLSRVRKRDIVEGDNRWWKLANVLEMESKWARLLDLIDESCGFHFVDDFLLGFGLPDEISICACRGDEPGEEWVNVFRI